MTAPFCIAFVAFAVAAPDEEPFRKTITSAENGVRLESFEVASRDVDPASPVPWSVRKTTLHGGKQEGVDLVVLDNGKLAITIVPTRGMGILRVVGGGARLGWDSPVKEVVHPALVNLESRNGLGWLEGFNEWLVRCGLEFAGHPGKDEFTNNLGERATMDLTLHGKVANIPASEVEVVVRRGSPARIAVHGRVDERMFYGPKLELWTELSTEPGSPRFRVSDTVTNRGAYDQEFQVIYHANYGPPLLEGGSRFLGAVESVFPLNAHAAEGISRFPEYGPPVRGFIEEVYCITPLADAEGRTAIVLRNAAADRGVAMRFSVRDLPFVSLWKNLTALEEGYVTGLEPGTGFPFNRRIERRAGRVPRLAPGAARSFTIDFEVLEGKDRVDAAAAEVERIRAGRAPRIDTAPPKGE